APGSVYLTAAAEGYAQGERRTTAPGATVEILVTPEAVLIGRGVEVGTKKPVADALVETQADWRGGTSGSGSRRRRRRGGFRITRLQPGRYRAHVATDTAYGESKDSVRLGLGQTSAELEVEVHAAVVVTGRVELDDGRPCADGHVGLRDQKRDAWGGSETD